MKEENDVVEDGVIEEIDDVVLKCYCNICNYYGKGYEVIGQFLGAKEQNKFL